MEINIRRALPADTSGLVASSAALFAEDGATRDRLISTYVSPTHRGQGIGARLIDAFRTWSLERGAERLRVSAYAANESAIRFYRRHGFAPLSIELASDAGQGGTSSVTEGY